MRLLGGCVSWWVSGGGEGKGVEGDEQVMDGCAGVASDGIGFVVRGGVGVDGGVFVRVGDEEGVAVCLDLVVLVLGVDRS